MKWSNLIGVLTCAARSSTGMVHLLYIYIYKEVTVEVLPGLIRFRVWKNIDCFTDFSSINRRVTNATIHLTKINNTKKEYQVKIASIMMRSVPYLVTLALLALAFPLASAFDPSALQDFCVAVNDSSSGGMYILVVFSIISTHFKILD